MGRGAKRVLPTKKGHVALKVNIKAKQTKI